MYHSRVMSKRRKKHLRAVSTPRQSWVRRALGSELFWLGVTVCVGVAVLGGGQLFSDDAAEVSEASAQMLFVGDIMLARHVETLMDARGFSYPFRGVRDLFGEAAGIVGNFEGAIPERHRQTPSGAMRFSVDSAFAAPLARVGFTHLSLANNHADDYGAAGYRNTRAVLAEAGIVAFGHPYELSPESISYQELGERVVALVPLYAVVGTPDEVALEETLAAASRGSDLQVVFVHWGDEYEPTTSQSQRALARTLVDLGADAVIGHHPHVVQDIEVYRGAPIFYSLGNFIFDQYWRSEVEEGLVVALRVEEGHARYELIPVTSATTPSAPRPMNRTERGRFLDALASRSEESLREDVRAGAIERPVF